MLHNLEWVNKRSPLHRPPRGKLGLQRPAAVAGAQVFFESGGAQMVEFTFDEKVEIGFRFAAADKGLVWLHLVWSLVVWSLLVWLLSVWLLSVWGFLRWRHRPGLSSRVHSSAHGPASFLCG